MPTLPAVDAPANEGADVTLIDPPSLVSACTGQPRPAQWHPGTDETGARYIEKGIRCGQVDSLP